LTQRRGSGQAAGASPLTTGALSMGTLSLVHCRTSEGGHPRGLPKGLAKGQPKGQLKGRKQIPASRVCFDREELTTLLNLYGRNVSSGEWRDYAMDFLGDRALFSIYRHNSEQAVFVIEKNPKLARKQGQYRVIGQQGRVLMRSRSLSRAVRVLDPGFMLVK